MLQPNIPISLKDLATIMLPTTATLLGLVYAGLIFWLQGGFAGLEYTAALLRPSLTANSKTLLDLLVGATAASLFSLLQARALTSLVFWIFAVVFIRDVMVAAEARGQIVTIFSTKSVPVHYGQVRRFFRYIRNGGIVVWLRIVLFGGLCVVYPFAISIAAGSGLMLTDSAMIVFLVASTTIALVQIRSLITEAVDARNEIERRQKSRSGSQDESAENGQNEEWPKEKRELEQRVLKEALQQVGVVQWIYVQSLAQADSWTSRDLREEPVLEFPITVEGHGNVFLCVVLPYFQTDIETRNYIYHWSRVIFDALANANTAVTEYALSWFRHDGDSAGTKTHFGVLRATRSEILGVLSEKGITDIEFTRKLKGRFLAPHVAEY